MDRFFDQNSLRELNCKFTCQSDLSICRKDQKSHLQFYSALKFSKLT